MDWINSLNTPASPSVQQRLMKTGGNVSPPPNLNHLLGGQQQQPQLNVQARHQGGSANVKASFDAPAAGKSVRIHPTEVQRFLQGLMNDTNFLSKPLDADGKSGSPFEHSGAQDVVAKPTGLPKGDGNAMNMNAALSNLDGAADAPLPNSSSHSSTSSGGGLQRQKNDKAVEVHKDRRVIARFRTQTECARYLRATPEAVSYHCSKGGGVCNGLVIKPMGDKLEQNGSTPYGLLEGAVEFRPKGRPQLKPETVKILKDWLLSPDHMDNPYPNARESEMLMQRTGLDRVQLKHWFNNARKRILKPLLAGYKPPEKKRGAKAGKATKKGKKKKRKNDDEEPPREESKAVKKKKAKKDGASPSLARPEDAQKMPSDITPREQEMLNQIRRERGYSNMEEEMMQARGYSHGGYNDMEEERLRAQYQRQMGRQDEEEMMRAQYQRQMGYDQGNGGQNANSMEEDMMRAQYQRQMGYGQDMSSRETMAREMMMRYGDSYGSSMQQSPKGMMGRGSLDGNAYGGGGYQGRSDMAGYCMDAAPSQEQPDDAPARRTSSEDSRRRSGPPEEDSAYCRQASDPPDESRTNAVFKQQVATMAMAEASTAFREMEEAFAQAKGLVATSRARNPEEDDPRVVEANERAKRLQGVAMFKLKVSQRASEEAATAYDAYQREQGGGGTGMGSESSGYR